jgi:hypothetical protein
MEPADHAGFLRLEYSLYNVHGHFDVLVAREGIPKQARSLFLYTGETLHLVSGKSAWTSEGVQFRCSESPVFLMPHAKNICETPRNVIGQMDGKEAFCFPKNIK